MRFPGPRIAEHYFPITKKTTCVVPNPVGERRFHLVGLDEVLVDIEVEVSPDLCNEIGLVAGESIQLSEEACRSLLSRCSGRRRYAAGGTVANTLNNFTHLSGEAAVLLGAIESTIRPGEPGFAYVAQTPKAVDLSHLAPFDGYTGTAITCISPDGDRAFGVAPGVADLYGPEHIPEDVVRSAGVVLTSLYCLRDPDWPIAKAAMRLMALAKEADVPVAFGLGTSNLVREKRQLVRQVLNDYATVAAMNVLEAEALTGVGDALLAAKMILEWVDVVIITEGPQGLTLGGYTDERAKRETKAKIRSKSIPEYNRWEYSRLLRRSDCETPLQVFSHIHPYRGGPDRLSNTSGAGDAALAAILHDIVANRYHRTTVPNSRKHAAPMRFLTYSSLSRNAQYGNRVAYEVLRGHTPRLDGPVGPDSDDPEYGEHDEED
ncbi:MAG: hypothetical protein A2289_24315 [Deltaproteobacteria bacterium RIFOXYA12_FULL_58_15]|nr:MAG: hypothetical protein A2289_24315 [Deltaproteobacteria bacterium RIFOXYA12_FULL_58_15]OGR14173.1 MAG: hypothetical protein A2341_28580 [Deltaproteobacteria bacterium RIFOXYB12_FULL_58_9]